VHPIRPRGQQIDPPLGADERLGQPGDFGPVDTGEALDLARMGSLDHR
jgi:hypothetical protein